MVTTVGRIKLSRALPEGFKNIQTPLTSKELAKVMTNLAKSVPSDVYVSTLKKLNTLGDDVASEYGGVASIHLSDVTIPEELKVLRDRLQRKVYNISQRSDIDSATKKKMIIAEVRAATPEIDKAVMEVLPSKDNSFGLLVGAGIKGKPQQLRQLVFGDLLTVDSKMRDIPYPTFRSYGEGITPLQYWTASHGGRYGYIQVQKATADAGYFSKQTRGVVHRQKIVTEDCGSPKPYMMDADDDNAVGSLLFKDTKGKSGKVYKADSPITEEMLEDLNGDILVRSAVCCGASDGLCSKCAGIRESGRLPDVGDAVGLNGINASNEQITQAGLCLHPDTLVRMADGSDKKIVDIQAGDVVLASDKSGNTFPANVVALHYNGKQQLNSYLFTSVIGDNAEVIATANHKVLTTAEHTAPLAGWKITEYLRVVGDKKFEALCFCEGSYDYTDAYDLELDTEDHLFVLSNGMVVSNSSKHGGGESVTAKRIKRGFEAIEQFINMPENFVGGAAVSPVAGKVSKIYEAPQGGKFIKVGDTEIHVVAGFEPTVKVGDTVEAGDLISDGMPNIEKITEYKGIGEGRRAFVEGLYDVLKQNGGAVPKKQLEPFARAYIDKIEITDPDGLQGHIYGDITTYNKIAAKWRPRVGTYETSPEHAVGSYLEMPALHYTIGTSVTPAVAAKLKRAGINSVSVNSKEPPFKPHVLSAKQFVAADEDWITALSGEGLTKSFIQHAQRGADSNLDGTSYYPQLAFIGAKGEKPLTVS